MQSTPLRKVLTRLLAVACTIVLTATARAQTRPTTAPTTPPIVIPRDEPVAIHVPGIGGYLAIDRRFMNALRRGGVPGTVVHFDWTDRDPGLRALVNADNKHAQSRALADIITRAYRDNPARPIRLTSHSGGGAIVTWALEHLPDDVRVEQLFLLSPALSPEYDLSRALARVRDRAFVVSSDADPILGAGTRLMGTMDGVRTDAMGRVGFTRPATADATQYAKLVAMPYRPEWVRYDNIGDHIGSMSPEFTEAVLIPLMLGRAMPAD